jgi:hypothetical protein
MRGHCAAQNIACLSLKRESLAATTAVTSLGFDEPILFKPRAKSSLCRQWAMLWDRPAPSRRCLQTRHLQGAISIGVFQLVSQS